MNGNTTNGDKGNGGSGGNDDIPIIDFSPWVTKVTDDMSEEEIQQLEENKTNVSKQIFDAFRTIGFISIINHGIDDDTDGEEGCNTTQKAFRMSELFFKRPREYKMKYIYKDQKSNRGYIAMGQEKLDANLPDIKETFDIGYEYDTAYKNEWPDDINIIDDENGVSLSFRDVMLEYFTKYDQLHLSILRALARGMNLPSTTTGTDGDDDYFTPLCNGNHQNLRLLHYPTCKRSQITKFGQKRGGIHTDYGTITLVSQNGVSGLIAQSLAGRWIPVPPINGGIVVNVGEMLQRWSNDILRATPHQILDDNTKLLDEGNGDDENDDDENDEDDMVPERYSIAFFCNANKETTLECLPVCTSEENPPKYEPINAYEYLTQRLTTTIGTTSTSTSTSTSSSGTTTTSTSTSTY